MQSICSLFNDKVIHGVAVVFGVLGFLGGLGDGIGIVERLAGDSGNGASAALSLAAGVAVGIFDGFVGYVGSTIVMTCISVFGSDRPPSRAVPTRRSNPTPTTCSHR
jgi:hypothetical protein